MSGDEDETEYTRSRYYDVPDVPAKDVKFENKLKQLLPILNDLEVVEAKDEKFILKHPNGKTVNTIIKEKLSEHSDTAPVKNVASKGAVQKTANNGELYYFLFEITAFNLGFNCIRNPRFLGFQVVVKIEI